MASMDELYRIAMMNQETENANSFPAMLNNALKSFQGGMAQAKAYDEQAIQRATQMIELQNKMQELQRAQMFNQMNGSETDNSNSGKTAALFEKNAAELEKSGPRGRQVAAMIKNFPATTPKIDSSKLDWKADSTGKVTIKPKTTETLVDLPFYNKTTGKPTGSTYKGKPGSEPKFLENPKDIEGDSSKRRLAIIQPQKTEEIYKTVESNNVYRDRIKTAESLVEQIPTGLTGKVSIAALRRVAPNSPILGKWQEIKALLTDAQLQNVAKTKGAVSDREMELFAQSAANDELPSVPRARVVLKAMLEGLNSNEVSILKSYKRTFGEDPEAWDDLKSNRVGELSGAENEVGAAQGKPRFTILEVK